jgi:hypothetical protein
MEDRSPDGATKESLIARVAGAIVESYSDPYDQKQLSQALSDLPFYVTRLLDTFYPEGQGESPDTHESLPPFPRYAGTILEQLQDRLVVTGAAARSFVIILAQIAFALKNNKSLGTQVTSTGLLADQLEYENDDAHLDARFGSSKCIYSGSVEMREHWPHGDLLLERLLNKDHYIEPHTYERSIDFDFGKLSGKRYAFVGAGGGSDCIQAAMLARLCMDAKKEVVCVATSEDPNGRMGVDRTVENYAARFGDNIFKISPETRGSGRFVENVPAADVDMFLVVEHAEEGGLALDIRDLIAIPSSDKEAHITGWKPLIDTLVIVDTGGDILEDPDDLPIWKQHQDLRVLHALACPGSALRKALPDLDIKVAIVAPGIDTPSDAGTKLQSIKPVCHFLDKGARQRVLETYKAWRFDGTLLEQGRYGKTPFAWQAAIRAAEQVSDKYEEERAEYGQPDEARAKTSLDIARARLVRDRYLIVALPLPEDRVMDENNPWNPFVPIQEVTSGVMFMEAATTLKVLAPTLPSQSHGQQDRPHIDTVSA